MKIEFYLFMTSMRPEYPRIYPHQANTKMLDILVYIYKVLNAFFLHPPTKYNGFKELIRTPSVLTVQYENHWWLGYGERRKQRIDYCWICAWSGIHPHKPGDFNPLYHFELIKLSHSNNSKYVTLSPHLKKCCCQSKKASFVVFTFIITHTLQSPIAQFWRSTQEEKLRSFIKYLITYGHLVCFW